MYEHVLSKARVSVSACQILVQFSLKQFSSTPLFPVKSAVLSLDNMMDEFEVVYEK